MALFKLLLKGFEFPADLTGIHSNFRFVFQLRHFDAGSETWVTTESVSPGLSSYWECDQAKANGGSRSGKYIRDGAQPKFRTPSPWDQVVLLVSSSELFQLRVTVYDVNREDWVDRLRELGEGLLGALVGASRGLPIPSQLAAPVATVLERVREAAIDRLAREDTVLFSVTYEFGSDQSSQPVDLPHGGYTMRLGLVTTGLSRAEPRAPGAAAMVPVTSGRIDAATAFAQVPVAPRRPRRKTTAARKTRRRR
jgi:hypothetical protein